MRLQIGGAQGRPQGRILTIRDLGRMVQADYELNGRRTLRRMQSSFVHLERFFADTPAPRIGPRSGDYIAARLGEGAAAGTIKVELMMLGRGLSLAVRAGHLRYRPVLASLRVSNARRNVITEEMLDSLLAYLAPDDRDVAEMAYLTGWRKSEILGLNWQNVDRLDRVIRLEPGTTKNGEGRVFPYGTFPQLEQLIERRWRKTLELDRDLGRKIPAVFHRHGRPIRGIRYGWRESCRRAGLEGFVFHDLRRSAAQNMVRAGIPIHTAMALLGHKTRSMFDRYAIVSEEDLRSGLARLSVRLANTRQRRREFSTGSLPGGTNERQKGVDL